MAGYGYLFGNQGGSGQSQNTGLTNTDPNYLYGTGLLNTLENIPFNKDNPYTNTLPGVGAGGRYPANNIAISLAPAEYWNLANQLGFYNSLQPDEHAAVMQYLNYLRNPQQMANQFRQGQMGQIGSETAQLQNQLASAGAGQGAKEAAALSLFNQANRNANQFEANLFSPQGQAQLAQGALGLIGSQAPNWGDILNIAQITGSTPRNKSGLDVLGTLAGDYLGGMGGGGLGGLLGGGGGGGGGNPSGATDSGNQQGVW